MNRDRLIDMVRSAASRLRPWALMTSVLFGIGTPLVPGQERFEFEHPAMGVQFRFVIYAESQKVADQAFRWAANRATELDEIFSDYKSDSEAMRLVRGAVGCPIEISQDLWTLMRTSDRIRRESEGAFDITAGRLTHLWRLARKRHRLPTDSEIQDALQNVGNDGFELIEPLRIILNSEQLRLDFGGIAKGYAADQCLAIFRDLGIESALVAASGDLALGAPPPGESGWRVGIAALDGKQISERSICLAQCGVSTSSDSLQALEYEGVRYSHIVDPRSGQAVTLHSSVTVVTDCATHADAWATALSVLAPERGIQLAEQRGNLQAMIVSEIDKGHPAIAIQTSGFAAIVEGRQP